MKALFITRPPEIGSTRFRFLPILPGLRERGIDVERVDIPEGLLARLRIFRRAREFDLVLFGKRLIPSWQFRLLRRWSRKLIFDFCDPIIYNKHGDEVTLSATRERRFRTIVSCADVVTAHNPVAAAMAREYGATRAEVFMYAVDPARFAAREGTGDGSVIGWLGTASNLRNLLEIAPALQGRTLRLVADKPLEIPGVRVDFVPWSYDAEPAELRRFDVALAPLPGDLWARGNLPLKMLYYMASGLPVIASRGEALEAVARHDENALLASTLEEWRAHVDRLAGDPELRLRLGRAARQTIERGHTMQVSIDRWAALLKEVGAR